MPKKRFNAEQIVTLLRQIEVVVSQGKAPTVACREAGRGIDHPRTIPRGHEFR
jgi:hypothetical protein